MRLGDGAHLVWYNNVMVKKSAAKVRPASQPTKSAPVRPAGLSWQQELKWSLGVLVRIVVSLALLVGMAYLMTWILTLKQNMDDVAAAEAWIAEKPVLYEYSVLVIFSGLMVMAAVTLRPILTAAIGLAVAAGLGYANYQKLSYRDAPVLPEDLKMLESAGNLSEFVDTNEVMQLVAGIVLLILGAWLLEHCLRKWLVPAWRKRRWWEKIGLVPRATLTLAAVSLAVCVTLPVLTRRGYGEWLEGAAFVDWNQTENYEQNGFVLGFLYNLGRMQVEEPEDYSEAEMQRIAEKYRALKAADTERVPLDEKVMNIVFIMNESFADPALFEEKYPHTGGDILPNLHQLFEEYPSGYMYSPEYGGGTANVEFEGYTGLSNYWARNSPYVNSLSKSAGVLSAASWAKLFGLGTWGLHAYDGTMYKRNIVYPILGFDEFVDENGMEFREHEGKSDYANDWSAYQEVLAQLRDEEAGQMIGLVTMQNHGPYWVPEYPEIDFWPRGRDDYNLAVHWQSIHNGDQYLADFLAEVAELDEPTVVLFFGDHAPGLYSEYKDSDDPLEERRVHLTPYLVYANFEIESPYTEAEAAELNEAVLGFEIPTEGVDLPTTTPNCLMNTVYNLLGVEKPALFYLLDEVCAETPVLSAAYYGKEAPEMTEALHDYELVNYDVLAGKHYWDGN